MSVAHHNNSEKLQWKEWGLPMDESRLSTLEAWALPMDEYSLSFPLHTS